MTQKKNREIVDDISKECFLLENGKKVCGEYLFSKKTTFKQDKLEKLYGDKNCLMKLEMIKIVIKN